MPKPNCVCTICGESFYRGKSRLKNIKHGVYCSRECFQLAPKTQKPEKRQKARKLRIDGWSVNKIADKLSVSKGTVSLWVRDMPRPENLIPKPKPEPKLHVRKQYVMDSQGYVMVPHPRNYKNTTYCGGRYVYLHRLVMERFLRRYLTSTEVVHHINGDKQDNRLDNLEITTASAHATHHGRKSRLGKFRCPVCSGEFTRALHQTHLKRATRFTCCSSSCANSMIAYIRREGFSKNIQHKIRRSLLEVFMSD
jgi:hypothetical protein